MKLSRRSTLMGMVGGLFATSEYAQSKNSALNSPSNSYPSEYYDSDNMKVKTAVTSPEERLKDYLNRKSHFEKQINGIWDDYQLEQIEEIKTHKEYHDIESLKSVSKSYKFHMCKDKDVKILSDNWKNQALKHLTNLTNTGILSGIFK